MGLIFEIKIRDSNYDEMAHVNKKPLKNAIDAVNYALQKEGLNKKIILVDAADSAEEVYS